MTDPASPDVLRQHAEQAYAHELAALDLHEQPAVRHAAQALLAGPAVGVEVLEARERVEQRGSGDAVGALRLDDLVDGGLEGRGRLPCAKHQNLALTRVVSGVTLRNSAY